MKEAMSTTPAKNIRQIMSSIQSKLQMLASDHLEAQPYPLSASGRQAVAPPSPTHSELQLSDLGASSPVASRLDHMEQQYIGQIAALNSQLAAAESELAQLRRENRELSVTLGRERQRCSGLEQESQQMVERKVEEIRQRLMERMRSEVAAEVDSYLHELQQMRSQLTQERKERKQLERELELVRLERGNYEELYRDMIAEQKVLLQTEIEQHHRQQEEKSELGSKVRITAKPTDKPRKKKAGSTGGRKERGEAEMSKEQLIPFLTKGIQELKEKLKLH